MLKKKEAIEIIKADLENAINSNEVYECTVRHNKGAIVFDDKFGEHTYTYETGKVFERSGTSTVEIIEGHNRDISYNVNSMVEILRDIRTLIQDTRKMLANHEIKEVFKTSQCNHIVGSKQSPDTGRLYLVTSLNEEPHFKMMHKFKYCPTCGYRFP